MAVYFVAFGPNDPRSFSGLTPTFITFQTQAGGTLAPPGITEMIAGTGAYQFTYSPSLSIFFEIDGGATLITQNRYISGQLDPDQVAAVGLSLAAVSTTLTAISSTLSAIAATLSVTNTNVSYLTASMGSTASSFGTDVLDPDTIYGYVKRLQEFLEGNAVFTKATGIWDIYSRGSSQLLREKVLTNQTATATKV